MISLVSSWALQGHLPLLLSCFCCSFSFHRIIYLGSKLTHHFCLLMHLIAYHTNILLLSSVAAPNMLYIVINISFVSVTFLTLDDYYKSQTRKQDPNSNKVLRKKVALMHDKLSRRISLCLCEGMYQMLTLLTWHNILPMWHQYTGLIEIGILTLNSYISLFSFFGEA